MNESLSTVVLLTSTRQPCSRNWMNIWKQLLSAPLGGFGFILTGLLLFAILKNERLRSRKEYRLMMALSFADFVEALASFIGAVYRLPHYYSDSLCYEYATPMFCMVLPHNILWRWSDTATAYMLVAAALDRYVAIGAPFFYQVSASSELPVLKTVEKLFRHGGRLALIMISVVYGISVLCMLYVWVMPIQLQLQGKMLVAVCSTSGLIDKKYTEIIKYASGAGSALSVVIHVVVAWKVRSYLARMEATKNFTEERPKFKLSKKEITFTLTSLVKGLCTLLLDSSTRIYGVYALQEQLTGYNPESEGFGSFLFTFNKVNGILNVFIYGGGQAEVRKAILSLCGLGHLVATSEDVTTRIKTDRTVTVISSSKSK